MENKVENLRKKYQAFKRGKESALAVRDAAQLVLEEAKERGDSEITEEIEDMIIDLLFSMNENKCNCNRKCSC